MTLPFSFGPFDVPSNQTSNVAPSGGGAGPSSHQRLETNPVFRDARKLDGVLVQQLSKFNRAHEFLF